MTAEMKRNTGLHCQACGAAAGHPCTVDCPEGGLAIAADRTIWMLTSLDLAKLPLAVTAAIGLLRSALEAQQRPAAPETDSINAEAFERDLAAHLAAYIGHLEFHEDCDHPAVIEAHATLLAHVAPRRQSTPAVGLTDDEIDELADQFGLTLQIYDINPASHYRPFARAIHLAAHAAAVTPAPPASDPVAMLTQPPAPATWEARFAQFGGPSKEKAMEAEIADWRAAHAGHAPQPVAQAVAVKGGAV